MTLYPKTTIYALILTTYLFQQVVAEEPTDATKSQTVIQDEEAEAKAIFFALKVLPIFKNKCLACHGEDPNDELRGEYDMRTRAGLIKGGESEEIAVIAGNPEESPLFLAVTWDDGYSQMPPKENDRLSEEQVAVLKTWIKDGAVWPDKLPQLKHTGNDWNQTDADGTISVRTSGGLSDDWTYRRYDPVDLWAYRPIEKQNIPWKALPASLKSNNPIDAFIYEGYNARKLKPAEQADKLTLIRRVTFDVTGLPPTTEEVEIFLQDNSADAYERLVDHLLSSSHYGERQAQHWLDVVRYADSAGYANDFERPHAWRYRDYTVRSFNQDKPFDQFLTEQIAGDELYEAGDKDPELLIATGFLRMGPWEHTGMSVAAETRQLYLDDVLNGVGQTFLGHNTTCFKCHDHKFDPLPTRDYYSMQAIFAPVQLVNRVVPFQKHENTSLLKEERPITDARLKDKNVNIGHVSREYDRLKKSGADQKTLDAMQQDLEDEALGLNKIEKKREGALAKERSRYNAWAMSVYNGSLKVLSNKTTMLMPKKRGITPQDIMILAGGSLEAPTEKVTPGVMSVVFGVAGTEDPGKANDVSSEINGRRLGFAQWIASSENPLTSRVYANRLWQQHFGKGIAENANNFGKMGKKPTHPELLDFLASYLTEHNWSTKAVHKLILMSHTYRLSSQHADQKTLDKVDPDNNSWVRFNPRRLSAEELRDGMLSISGELNKEMGGLPVRPEINMEVAMQPRHVMGSVAPAYQPNIRPEQRNRRTLYAMKIRSLRDPMLEVFDQPSPELSCERRDQSTVTPQVFSLFNGQNSYDRSLALAAKLEKQSNTKEEQVNAAFQLLYGRDANQSELQASLKHLAKMTVHHKQPPPVRVDPPTSVDREMVEEMTGLLFAWTEKLDIFSQYESDLKPWDVEPSTRALADLCLVLFNSNEFVYIY